MQRMTPRPSDRAAEVLRATNCKASVKGPSNQQVSAHVVSFVKNGPPLAVAGEHPCDAGVGELASRDLAGECAVGAIEDILGCDLDALAQVFPAEQQVQSRRSNDNLFKRLAIRQGSARQIDQ